MCYTPDETEYFRAPLILQQLTVKIFLFLIKYDQLFFCVSHRTTLQWFNHMVF